MCPDIENYAPLITAAFGLGDVVDGRPPGTPAPRPARRPVARPHQPAARRRRPAARRRRQPGHGQRRPRPRPEPDRSGAGSASSTTTSTRWPTGCASPGSGGASTPSTAQPFGVRYLQNTWRFGLDRVLTGVALSDDSQAWLGTALPLDDVGSNRVELAGRFAEYVDRLVAATDRLTGTRPLAEWLDGLADRRRRADPGRARRPVAGRPGAARAGPGRAVDAGERGASPLRLTDVRAMLDDHLAGRPTRANFRAGSLTVCTMVPMRSVPHRVVCLLGLDDGVFPRQRTVDGDDVLARTPVTGERDIRSEDRQLLLDAIGAATERLVVTYTGADPHSGQDRPPAVPLGELLDALDRTTEAPVRGDDRRQAPAPGLRPAQRRARPARHARRRSPSTRRCWRPRPSRPGRGRPRRRSSSEPLAEPVSRAAADDDLALSRPGHVLPRPGQGLLPRPRPDAAVGRRRGQRRDARRDRPARDMGRGRPDARGHAARHPPGHRARRSSGGAVHCRPASWAGARRPRSARPR